MEIANPSSTLESLSQESLDTTHAKFTARINKLLAMRQTIDSILFKTINEMTNQSFDFEVFCPEERIKELELRTQRRNNFKEGLFKDRLTYDESLGLIRFAQRDDEVMFRMPQRVKELDRVSPLEKDKFKAFFVDSLKVRKMGFKHVLEKRKGYYKACMNLGRNYKRDREIIEKLKTNHVGIIKLKE
ncbi:hypothetical protein Tco_1278997 [Tanacetum coccineum]